MRCVLSEARAQFESVFKWFRRVAASTAGGGGAGGGASAVSLTEDDCARVSRALETHLTSPPTPRTAVHAVGAACSDWFLPHSLSPYLSPGTLPPRAARVGPGVALARFMARVPGGIVSVEHDTLSLRSCVSEVQAAWARLLRGVSLASSFGVVMTARLGPLAATTPGAGTLVATHCDATPAWPLGDGSSTPPASSLMLCVCSCARGPSVAPLFVVRVAVDERGDAVAAGCAVTVRGSAAAVDGAFYGHVRDGGCGYGSCCALRVPLHVGLHVACHYSCVYL
jgi:hypothetical protein